NWPSIERHGLLSTSALLDLLDLPKQARDRYERRHRPTHTALSPGGIQIRDQKPMPVGALERCVIGLTPFDWYYLLNRKVFFWLDAGRLNRHRKACGARPQMVLVVDTERLLNRHAHRVTLSPINSGNARRKPAVRGKSTFVAYAEWSKSGWLSEAIGLGTTPRARTHRPVELAVEGSIVDILECLDGLHVLGPGETFCSGTTTQLPR
ncbi:MAG TPA: hypothetical protein VJ746_01285, partial [Nitrospira sp.]|nr:hypothetical protein [Nitrospira sp.]